MSVSRENQDRIERAIDGQLSPDELHSLQAEVVRDAVLRAEYVDRVWIDAALRADREGLRNVLSSDATLPSQKITWMAWAGAGVIAAAACVALGFSLRRPTPERLQPVATIVQAQNAKWSGSTLPTAEQSKLGRGLLALAEGIVTLRFESGATVTLEAPSKLEIVSAMNCRLIEGSLTADVPEAAHGFAVDTADLRVVDLGTRFGVTTGSTGNSHVFVFEGEVALRRLDGREVYLTEGKAFHVASGATAPIVEPARFQTPQPIDGWMAIPTSFGGGRDAYARRTGNPAVAGGEPLLMVKHTELESSWKNERRALITFDLSEIRPGAVEEAQLILDPEPSGMGFTSMVPDARFAVYGVKKGNGGETWDEDSLTWENLPACNDAGVINDQVRRLAEFWIPRGSSGDPITIRSDALTQFVRQDGDRTATFLIVRETGETHSSGLVHAFASKEHPTGRPPTLRTR